MYNLVALSTFTMLCNLHLVSRHFHHPRRKPHAHYCVLLVPITTGLVGLGFRHSLVKDPALSVILSAFTFPGGWFCFQIDYSQVCKMVVTPINNVLIYI